MDDSRSARAFLARILARYDLSVDTVENAEQALEYLGSQRPDVIFMDHLMPGMDGFQAVQAIKNNPRTATIPIMMYTSQEGELYLSQARALGAIGVLPKQIKPVDVSKTLEQLKLLEPVPESTAASRSEPVSTPVVTPAALAAGHQAATSASDITPRAPIASEPPRAVETTVIDVLGERRSPDRPVLPAMPPELRSIVEAMIGHHVRDLRRFMVDSLEGHADRIVGDVRLLMHEQQVPPANAPLPAPVVPPRRSVWPWAVTALALLGAGVLGWQWSQQRQHSGQLASALAESRQQAADAQRALQALQAADAAAAAAATAPVTEAISTRDGASLLIEPVPYGETPLAGARLERIGTLLDNLNAQHFHGAVTIRLIPGKFCLMSGASGALLMASDATLYSKCELVGNPHEADEFASTSTAQSVAFANLVATARGQSGDKLDIEVVTGKSDEVLTPYPPVTEALTAGEWNHIAAANNRVEVRWHPTR